MNNELVKYPIIEVTFHDITTWDNWEHPECAKDETPCLCKAVGYLVHEDDSFIKLVFFFSEDRFASRVLIPKGCIIEKKILG